VCSSDLMLLGGRPQGQAPNAGPAPSGGQEPAEGGPPADTFEDDIPF